MQVNLQRHTVAYEETQKMKGDNVRIASWFFSKEKLKTVCTPNFQQVLTQLNFFSKNGFYQGLAPYNFINSSFLFLQA